MQIQFLFSRNVAAPRNEIAQDVTITNSALADLRRKTFGELGPPPQVIGVAKLAQQNPNIDCFDLYFFSSSYSDAYEVGRTYTIPGGVVFTRKDFEQFPDSLSKCRSLLDDFTTRLVTGKLATAHYEPRYEPHEDE